MNWQVPEIRVRPGRARAALAVAVVLAAVGALWAVLPGWPAAALAGVLVAGAAWRRWKVTCPRRLRILGEHVARVEGPAGRVGGQMVGVFVSPALIAFGIRPGRGRTRGFSIFADELPEEEYRRLAAALRLVP